MKNYTVNEYLKGNKVNSEVLQNAQRTVNFINDVLAAVPNVVITSTVRTESQNKAVGGVENSKHLVSRALAVDFRITNLNASEKAKIQQIASSHDYGYLEHNVKTGNHIHCEYRPKK